ncbi:MAG: penicillin-binding transpeptidase domain-containing protein, partial [Pseudomonadota bacterium]
ITASYGHGLSVTPLHFITAFSTAVNGGYYVKPGFARISAFQLDLHHRPQIFKAQTSLDIRKLLRLNVLVGSGTRSDVPGLLVGGKTGTAEKINQETGRYDGDLMISSYVAAFPMDDPQYSVFAMINEPKPDPESHIRPTGGVVAAPLVGRVIARIAPFLNIFANRLRARDFDKSLLDEWPDDVLQDDRLVKRIKAKLQ